MAGVGPQEQRMWYAKYAELCQSYKLFWGLKVSSIVGKWSHADQHGFSSLVAFEVCHAGFLSECASTFYDLGGIPRVWLKSQFHCVNTKPCLHLPPSRRLQSSRVQLELVTVATRV